MTDAHLLNAEELAARLRVSVNTVRGWSRAGRIPSIRISRKTVRYALEQVLEALNTTESIDAKPKPPTH